MIPLEPSSPLTNEPNWWLTPTPIGLGLLLVVGLILVGLGIGILVQLAKLDTKIEVMIFSFIFCFLIFKKLCTKKQLKILIFSYTVFFRIYSKTKPQPRLHHRLQHNHQRHQQDQLPNELLRLHQKVLLKNQAQAWAELMEPDPAQLLRSTKRTTS